MKVSNHLDVKPYQVAVTGDASLPFRKWDHMGTVWAVSALSAAYTVNSSGNPVQDALCFRFPDGESVSVRV